MRLAIAEPDPAAADLLMFVAQRRGHQPVCVPGIQRLFDRLPFEPSAAIVSLADLDDTAIQALERLRHQFPEVPIVLITERSPSRPPIMALKAGANDVILSPYNPYEVILRLESWASVRSAPGHAAGGIRLGDLEVDLDAFAATKNGKALPLTRLERRLLYCLCQHHPNIAPIDRLLVFGWESLDDPDAALLKTHISHIRKKLRDAGGVPFEIVSQQSIGYALRMAGEQTRQLAS